MIGEQAAPVNISDMPNTYDNPILYGGEEPRVITFSDIMTDLGEQMIFKITLVSFMFFFVMLYLQYYCKHMEIRTNRDKYLKWIADIFFIPSAVFPIILIGHYTGWYI